jgi:glycosyltransferase involved in cell wall biosynthesis
LKTNKISGLIITYNEEKNIKEVLENLNFVDEIIKANK